MYFRTPQLIIWGGVKETRKMNLFFPSEISFSSEKVFLNLFFLRKAFWVLFPGEGFLKFFV